MFYFQAVNFSKIIKLSAKRRCGDTYVRACVIFTIFAKKEDKFESLLNLQDNKRVCHRFMDTGRRHRPLALDSMDFIHKVQQRNCIKNVSVGLSLHLMEGQGWVQMSPHMS